VQNKSQLAKELGVSRASLYYKPKMEAKDLELKKKIREIHAKHPNYGHKRLALELKVNRKRVLRVMKKFGIKPPRRRSQKPRKADDEGKPAVKHPNLIKNICPIRPDLIWASDFTYIKFKGKFIYLATVTDIFTRRIVGWQVLDRHDTSLVKLAFENAFKRTGVKPSICHSDQGSEYTGSEYIKMLTNQEIKVSFSAKASPWQNGFQESFYAGFKLDLGHIDRFENLGKLIEAIHLTLHYYNNQRIHTALKMPPQNFFDEYLIKFNSTVKSIGFNCRKEIHNLVENCV